MARFHYTVGRFRAHGRLRHEKWPLKEFPVRKSEFAIRVSRVNTVYRPLGLFLCPADSIVENLPVHAHVAALLQHVHDAQTLTKCAVTCRYGLAMLTTATNAPVLLFRATRDLSART